MNTKQAMEVVIGGSIDPSFKRAFQSADKQFAGLNKDIYALKKKQKLISKFEMEVESLEVARGKLQLAQKATMKLRKELISARKVGDKAFEGKLSKQLEIAKRKADRLSAALEKQKSKLQQTSSAMQQAGLNTRQYNAENQKLSRTLETLQKRQQRLASLASQKQNLKSSFSNMKGRAMGMAAAGTAGGFAMRPGLDFQTAASELQAKSSGMSDAQRKMLEDQAKELQLSMKFTGAEVLQGQTYLSMAGFKPEEIKSASKGMLDLAAASGMGLAESADISSNILSSFSLKAKEMGRVSDVLTQTFTSSNVTLSMLGETMKYVGPVASKAGASMEEVAAMVGLLGNVGTQGSMAGTALRAAFTRLSAPPKKAADALKDLGIKSKDAAGNLRPMPVLLEEIAAKTKDMGTGDRAEFISKIFGTEANAAMQELIDKSDDVEGGFQSMYETVKNSQGKAAKVAAIMNDNVEGSFTRLGSSISAMGQAAFEPFQDSIQSVIDSVAGVVGKTAEWMGQHPELVKGIAMVAGSLFALGTATLVTKAAFMGIKYVGLSGLSTLLRFTPVIGGVVRGFGLLRKAAPMVVTGIRAIGLALMANPIGALIGGIAIAATAIYANWDKIGPYFHKSLDAIKGYLSNTWQAMKFLTVSAFEGIKGVVTGAWSMIKQAFFNFTPLGIVIKNWDPIKGYVSGVMGAVKSKVSGAWTSLKSVFSGFDPLGAIKGKWDSMLGWFKSLPKTFKGFGSMVMTGLKHGLLSGVSKVTDAIQGVAGKITGKFKSLLGIKSPSRVFMQQGDFIMQGLERGIVNNSQKPLGAISKVGLGMQSANDRSLKSVSRPVALASALGAAVSPAMLAANQSASSVSNHYEIHVHAAPGMDAQDLALQVRAEMEKLEQEKHYRSRAGFYDQGGY